MSTEFEEISAKIEAILGFAYEKLKQEVGAINFSCHVGYPNPKPDMRSTFYFAEDLTVLEMVDYSIFLLIGICNQYPNTKEYIISCLNKDRSEFCDIRLFQGS